MFKYETHLHTFPVSQCAKYSVRENLEFYKKLGYEGIFITNHFIDGNINHLAGDSFEDRINYFFSDVETALEIADEIGIKVFCGAELSYGGTDFLVYGLDKDWYLAHPEIMSMKKSEELPFLIENGALVIQAHPFREAFYIDHIRLFPRCVHGVEIINANRTENENKMAKIYAENYELLEFAGSDNHIADEQKKLAGLQFETPIKDEKDFCERVKNNNYEIFSISL